MSMVFDFFGSEEEMDESDRLPKPLNADLHMLNGTAGAVATAARGGPTADEY